MLAVVDMTARELGFWSVALSSLALILSAVRLGMTLVERRRR